MVNLPRNSWFITLLSALLFNLAWLNFYTGWLVIVSFLLIFYLFNHAPPEPVEIQDISLEQRPVRGGRAGQPFSYGFVWGLLVFSFHFHWLILALLKHASCSALFAGTLIAPVLCYFSLLTGVWFYIMQRASRLSSVLIIPVSALFWYVLDGYALVPVGMGMGYPVINPCLPLMRYRWILALFSCFWSPVMVLRDTKPLIDQLCFVQPVVNRAWCYGEPWTQNPYAVVHRIHKQITSSQLSQSAILVAPESMALFALDEFNELVKVLSSESNDKQCFILGSLRKRDKQIEQVAYCLQQGLIIKTYVKKILVPFAEQTPPAWQWLQGLRHRFSPMLAECVAGAIDVKVDEHFYVAGCCVRPALCLEFFELSARALCAPETDVIMALVNDSWYTPLFREWLFLLAILKSHTTGRLVVYIGHYGCYTIEPKNHSIIQVRSCYASLHA